MRDDLNERAIFDAVCYLGGQGERLRVSHKFGEGIPLNAADQAILDRGVSTIGEHVEAGRRGLLRVARLLFTDDELEALLRAIASMENEGSGKP